MWHNLLGKCVMEHIQMCDGKQGCLLLSNGNMISKLAWLDSPSNKNLMLTKSTLPFSYYHVSVHNLSFTLFCYKCSQCYI